MTSRFASFAAPVLAALVSLGSLACSVVSATHDDYAAPPSGYDGGAWDPSADTGYGAPSDASPSADSGSGSYGSVGVGGSQDFAAFRKALDEGRIPSPDSLDATGFFAEHYTSLPTPTCGKTFCLHGMLSVSADLVRGGDWTLLQMGMNSPIDPATIAKPRLDVAVVLDHSGSMANAGKLDYAKLGVKALIDGLDPEDTFTLIAFNDRVAPLFGPAKPTDKAAIKAKVDALGAEGDTDIYQALETGYQKVIEGGGEQLQRRVVFLTDGVPTAGNTDLSAIATMSAKYNDKYVGLTTIGLGSDVNTRFLRGLSETGGGNFYFIEKPEAVADVFKEELAFFVAPIAYDLDLTFTELPDFSLKTVHGTNLWKGTTTGGAVHVPSVFLVSRTSSAPGPSGGRRGGGAAIIAELAPKGSPLAGMHDVARLDLRYRLPGSTDYETQTVTVSFDGTPGKAPEGGYYQTPSVEKNSIVLSFFIAFRDATAAAAKGDRAGAKKILEDFKPRIVKRLEGWTDEDLLDDLKILDQYVGVLSK